MDNSAIHTEAGGGVEASRCCELTLVELEMPGDSTCPFERTVNAGVFF